MRRGQRRVGRLARGLSVCMGMVLWCSTWSSHAQAQSQGAAEHFDAALRLVETGDLAEAASEFERAYELSPHYSVLYNLAQVYGRLGRHLDAVATLERYLREAAGGIDEARRTRVREALEQEQEKIATLRVELVPSNATIRLDGVVRGLDDGRLLVDPRVHELTVSHEGYESHKERLELSAGELKKLRVELNPKSRTFELEIRCPLPDVVLEVDGQRVARLPGGRGRVSKTVATREPKVRFVRDGYAPQSLALDPAVGRQRITCDLEPIHGDETQLASLSLRISEPDPEVRVDGEPYMGQPLVPGRHLLSVEREGFEPWVGYVELAAGETGSMSVRLHPTPAFREDYEQEAKRQRGYAYAFGSAGLALGATGGALYAWGFERQAEYERMQRRIAAPGDPAPGSPEERDNQRLRDSIVLYDRVALGLALAGAVALGTAIWIYVDGDDPERYEGEGSWTVGASLSALIVQRRF